MFAGEPHEPVGFDIFDRYLGTSAAPGAGVS